MIGGGAQGSGLQQGLLGLRRQARRLNPKLAPDRGTLADLSWQNYVKEVFLDSETAIGLISTPPGPYPQEAVVPPKEMTHIRDEINRVTQSRRVLAHGLVTPQLGQADLDFMDLQDPQGLPEPDTDGVSRRRGRPQPPVVRMGRGMTRVAIDRAG